LVEETVGHGFLPTEPEHTLADIASLFKKIIMGLPGGLLGSVELFEVLRSILVDQRANLESSEQDTVQLPAKLIALAISSVVSHLRLNLIQAVIGLVAHFGYQGDKFQEAEKVAAEERGERNQSRSEVMGSESLSRVFGALLLGDLTDEVEVTNHSPTTLDTKPPPSNSANQDQEVSKKSKKQKHVTFPTKSDNDAKLLAHVNRANLMTDIVRSLLLIWQEVVKQLRELNAVSTSNVHLSRSKDHLQKLPIRAARGVPLRNSREEMQLSNILHGRAPPGIPFPYQVKQTVRVSNRSPMGRIATHTSEDSNTGLTGPSKASLQLAQPSPAGSNGTPSSAGRGHGSANKASPSPPDAQTPFTEDLPVIHRQKRKKSDNSMDPMAMGTFLTPPNNSTAALMQFPPALHNSPIETPRKQSHSGSSDYVPETAVRMLPRPGQQQTSVSPIQKSIVRKPLPAIPSSPSKDSVTYLNLGEGIDPIKPKSNQSSIFTESSSPTTKKSSPSSSHQSEQESLARFPDESTYPPRRSSLLKNQQLALSPNDRLLTSRDLDEHSTWPRSKSDSATKNLTSRKTAGVVINKGQAFEDAKQDCAVGMESLAQGFPKASGAIYNNEQTRLPIEYPQIPKAHAYAGPIPQENYHGNSSGALANMSPGRESMIPRPVKEVGRGRSPMRTPPHAKHVAQPTPKSYSQERPFVHDLDQDTDAELASANGKVEERTLNDAPKPVEGIMPSSIQQRTGSDQSTSRDINTYSDQPSSHKYSKALEDDFDKQKTERKNLQRDPSIGGILSPSQSNALGLDNAALEMSSLSPVDSSLNASEGLKQFKRHQSINGTRHQEVRFLWRLLDNQFEETWIARRDLDTLREAIEAKAYSPSKGSSRGSWSKGMWSEDVKEAKEERNMWRKRAEVAESKIANLEKHGVDVNILLGSKKEEDYKHKQVTAGNRFSVEVVVENDDETPESVVDCYVGEGWEARDLDEKFT